MTHSPKAEFAHCVKITKSNEEIKRLERITSQINATEPSCYTDAIANARRTNQTDTGRQLTSRVNVL